MKYERYYNWEAGHGRLAPGGANRIWQDYGVSYDFMFLGVVGRVPSDMRDSWLAFQKDVTHK